MNIQHITNNAEAMTSVEWKEICMMLQDHHILFYKIWEMGKPCFSKEIPTAAIKFDKTGNFIYFIFNPDFWATLDSYNKLFVICHESIHILFNHGFRFKDSKDYQSANIAMDVAVNHTLINQFGFDRSQIANWKDFCWTDTVFPKIKVRGFLVSDNETAEFYLNLLEKKKNSQQPKNGSDSDSQQKESNGKSVPKTVDQHSFGNGDGQNNQQNPDDFSKILDKLNQSLSNDEKESIKGIYKKHTPNSIPLSIAGNKFGNRSHNISKINLKVKKKWESIIKTWTIKKMMDTNSEVEQWARKHRRFNMLGNSLFLPSDMDIDNFSLDKGRIVVYFYLDTSGSCWNLKDRFFAVAESLPKNKFDVRLFCFDTKVVPTTLESKRIYGGGGTCFAIIEQNIQNRIKKDKQENKKTKYPDSVWIITDGYGSPVIPEIPDKWHWFIDKGGVNTYIPKNSKTYKLDDYV